MARECGDDRRRGVQLGIMTPEMQQTQQLRTGQVGYVVTGLKSTKAARVGDTWHHHKAPSDPLPGFRAAKAMMFAGASVVAGANALCTPHS